MSRDTLARLARLPVAVVLVALMVLAGGAHYVVSPGDTLSSIARQESVTVADLAAANGIENPDMILAGTPLVLPSKSTATPAGVGSHQTHLVARGESIASIAANHGVAVGQIEEANGIVNGVIYAGTTLRLSGSGFVARNGGVLRHVSSSDDTVSHIALHHGVTAHDLAHANDLAENSRVSAGQVLRIPTPWVCPVSGARYFNDWGFPRSGQRTHTGNDLFARRGTPVRAPVGGTVSQVTGSIGGKQFILVGDDGNKYTGSHMDAFDASGRVDAGTVIGTVGDTGNARGSDPHLHFEIHPGGGEATNPYPALLANDC